MKAHAKNMVRRILYSARLISTPNSLIFSNLKNLKYYFKSRRRNPQIRWSQVACIMCTWMEESIVPLAIESSKDFVSRYIVVDKDGSTVPAITRARDEWGLEMEVHVKPEMTLREARAFALTRIEESWVLVQDGDEVFHTTGPNNIKNLRNYMDRPHIVLCTPMNVLCGDFLHTRKKIPQQPPHMFLYHNNGTIRAPSITKDLPIMNGWKIVLDRPYKFNCLVKSPKRLFLRMFWNKWCQKSMAFKKYPNLEDYVVKELGINLDIEVEKWYREYLGSFIPYDEEKMGYYPEVIKRRLNMT